ncbi:MAG: response regulator [Gluconacetobacter diazotrophicus]|nr:response regulator [Gluconacetobacter diazotrophicus]
MSHLPAPLLDETAVQPSPRLLLVEDDLSTRDLLHRILADDYEVEAAETGEQAWETIQQQKFDLVLCDVFLPGLDGIELTRRLRGRDQTATVPIILLTAGREKELVLRGLEAGADDFLTKPFHPPELQARLGSHRQLVEMRREAAAREGDERYRQIVESARDYAIFTFDAQHQVTSWNAGAEAMTGFAAADVIGRPVDLLFTPTDREQGVPEMEIRQAHQTGHFYNERWHLRKDGTQFWGSGIVMPLRGDQPRPGCMKILRDQTALHQAEEDRARLLQVAQAARQEAENANATKDRLLAAVSHELRTPLAPVTLALHYLASQGSLPDAVREIHTMISRHVNTEIHLIDDLLDVSRISHGKLAVDHVPTDLHAVVRQALETCRAELAARELELTADLAASRHQVLGDAGRLQQVFCNLLGNAAKFTPPRGRITVRSSSTGDSVVVEVSDTGVGIEAAALPKIFGAFEQEEATLTRSHQGLGVGLAIAHAIVAAHGGQITAESFGRDQGATFRVRLPTRTG